MWDVKAGGTYVLERPDKREDNRSGASESFRVTSLSVVEFAMTLICSSGFGINCSCYVI